MMIPAVAVASAPLALRLRLGPSLGRRPVPAIGSQTPGAAEKSGAPLPFCAMASMRERPAVGRRAVSSCSGGSLATQQLRGLAVLSSPATATSSTEAGDSSTGNLERPSLPWLLAVAASVAMATGAGGPCLAKEPAAFSGVDDANSDLVQGLLKKSKDNKAKNDQDRLDRFYNKEFAINKILGAEVIPDACDPRDPEYGYRCLPRLPRLPEDRLTGGAQE